MKQRTVKRAVEALNWLHNNAHHIAGVEGDKMVNGKLTYTHAYYQNYHERLRVPAYLMPEVSKYIRVNKRKFDTRMYALTAAGVRLVTR